MTEILKTAEEEFEEHLAYHYALQAEQARKNPPQLREPHPGPYLYIGHNANGMTLEQAGSEEVLVAAAAGWAQPRTSLEEIYQDFRSDFPFGTAQIFVLSMAELLAGKPPLFEVSVQEFKKYMPFDTYFQMDVKKRNEAFENDPEWQRQVAESEEEHERDEAEYDYRMANPPAPPKYQECGMCGEITSVAEDFCIHCGD